MVSKGDQVDLLRVGPYDVYHSVHLVQTPGPSVLMKVFQSFWIAYPGVGIFSNCTYEVQTFSIEFSIVPPKPG